MTEPSIEPNKEPSIDILHQQDVVVEFLKTLKFDTKIFDELDACSWNQEKYAKYFVFPELFAVRNAIGLSHVYDPDRDSDEHKAFINLMTWMMIKMATHPYWHQKFGWLIRFMAGHTVAGSYWPIKFSPFFIVNNWKSMHDNWNKKEENEKALDSFEDTFKWETNESRLEELLRVTSKEWILEHLEK